MLPNCQFINDFIVFGENKKGVYVSKGFLIDIPDKSGASDETKQEFRMKLNRMLKIILRDGFDIQVKRSFDSDYSNEIETYLSGNEGGNDWSDHVRNSIGDVYNRAVETNYLRREYMQIFVGRWYKSSDKKVTRKAVIRYLESIASLFDSVINQLKLPFDDGIVREMTSEDYFERYFKMFNKSFTSTFRRDVGKSAYIPEMSMQDNCMLGDIKEVGDGVSGLSIDGYHHGFLTLSRWPDNTLPLIAKKLTDMSINDFDITFTLYSTDVEKEKLEAKSVLKNLNNSTDVEEQEMYNAMDDRLRSLTSGSILPVYGVYVISIWSKDLDDLKIQLDAAKSNIMAMDGALFFNENMPKKAREVFYMTFPGWMGSSYANHRKLYAEAHYAADLLPISSSFTGYLKGAEALFDGEEGSLVGVKFFQGSTPLHWCMFGETRAGKSVTAIHLLSQIYPSLGYMCIVESGNSYLTWVKAQGKDSESIVINPNGTLTINYFDTMGLPLSSEQKNNAVGLLMCIIGASQDEDKNQMRQSLLSKAVQNIYVDKFNQWKMRNQEKYKKVRHAAVCINRLQQELPADSNSYIDAFKAFTHMQEHRGSDYESLWNDVTETDINEFEKNPKTKTDVMNLSYALFEPDEFPTHGAFVENLRAGEASGFNAEMIEQLADLLEQWRRNGPNGPLIDGASTVRIDKRVVHFELGLIPEANMALKNIAGFLINNMVRNHVQSLPRNIKKCFIFEELSRFLNIPGSDKIVKETFAQMGKFSCCVGVVTQQYAQFMENLPVAKVALGNASQFFLLKNKREDVDDLGPLIKLPDVSREIITNFQRPVDMQGEKYSSFLYFSATGGDNVINGVCRVYTNPALLYVANSEGAEFQKRMEELKGHEDNLLPKILELTQ